MPHAAVNDNTCIPVAQYLRMSTEHQQYSTANQSVAILQYAQMHNMEIVRTYADHGKSGLDLIARPGLKQLLKEALEPGVDFRAVLVYDVSRWGRFQNPDEAASHEYRLNQAKIPVHYCAELFENDGSLASTILKTVKRGMAGEYSRELSAKVWAGNCRIATLGFHIGGVAGYGLRRQLIGLDGKPKLILDPGERKNLQSERVILVPGPANEIRVIRKIYKMYIEDRLRESEIARKLNDQKVPWVGTKPWTRMCVRQILTNAKYIGVSVYNRKSCKLHSTVVLNPRSEWIWREGAFKPVVSEERFEEARKVFIESGRDFSAEQLLCDLRAFLKRKKRVSQRLIDATAWMASSNTYRLRFGSLRNAYRLAGWKPEKQARHISTNCAIFEIRSAIISSLVRELAPFSASVSQTRRSCLFKTESGIAISLAVARCSQQIRVKDDTKRWFVYVRDRQPAHFRVVARLKQNNDAIMDYYIFPKGIIPNYRITLAASNSSALDTYRFESLDVLPMLLRCTDVEGFIPGQTDCIGRQSGLDPLSSGRFAIIRQSAHQLMADDNFRTLLRAEGHTYIPEIFWHSSLLRNEQMLALVVCEDYFARILGNGRVRLYIENRHTSLLMHLERQMGVSAQERAAPQLGRALKHPQV